MRYLKYVWLCFYLFIITIIFSKAAASGEKSAAESNKVTDIVIGVVDDIRKGEEPIADKYGLENVRIFIRKAIGHFGIFLVLGLFAVGVYFSFINKRVLTLILLFGSGFLVAAISEFIQIFADSRGPSIKEVMIDYSGYLIGNGIVILFMFIIYSVKKNKKRKLEENI